MWKDENAKSWRWSWWIYLNTSILWCGFFCMHTWIENDVHRFYTSFSRQRPFFILEEIHFVTLVSRICESLYWGWLELIAWLFFLPHFPPSVSHSSTLTSWLVWPARPWIWCHFNIGLILVVQIKKYEQFVWVWHQYLQLYLQPYCFSVFRPTSFIHMQYHTNPLWGKVWM